MRISFSLTHRECLGAKFIYDRVGPSLTHKLIHNLFIFFLCFLSFFSCLPVFLSVYMYVCVIVNILFCLSDYNFICTSLFIDYLAPMNSLPMFFSKSFFFRGGPFFTSLFYIFTNLLVYRVYRKPDPGLQLLLVSGSPEEKGRNPYSTR